MSSWKKGISVYLDGETDDSSSNEVLPRCLQGFHVGERSSWQKNLSWSRVMCVNHCSPASEDQMPKGFSHRRGPLPCCSNRPVPQIASP